MTNRLIKHIEYGQGESFERNFRIHQKRRLSVVKTESRLFLNRRKDRRLFVFQSSYLSGVLIGDPDAEQNQNHIDQSQERGGIEDYLDIAAGKVH